MIELSRLRFLPDYAMQRLSAATAENHNRQIIRFRSRRSFDLGKHCATNSFFRFQDFVLQRAWRVRHQFGSCIHTGAPEPDVVACRALLNRTFGWCECRTHFTGTKRIWLTESNDSLR